eukprot:738309-Prorocentrum_minimum.AAC.12
MPSAECLVSGVQEGVLVSPCACRGSNALIHTECLKAWHTSLGNPTDLRCPTCKQHYYGEMVRARLL